MDLDKKNIYNSYPLKKCIRGILEGFPDRLSRQVDILPLRPLIIDGSSLVFSVERLEFHDFSMFYSIIFSMFFP